MTRPPSSRTGMHVRREARLTDDHRYGVELSLAPIPQKSSQKNRPDAPYEGLPPSRWMPRTNAKYPLAPGRWDRASQQGRIRNMSVERCVECGFDSDEWSDAGAIATIKDLPLRWTEAVAGLTPTDQLRRPDDQMWSIAEYTDHVREVLFGMRFLLDTAISQPGIDLGPSPSPQFASQPRRIDVQAALDGIDHEAFSLSQQLSKLSADDWLLTVMFDGSSVDPHWIARHIVHDATHHLLDIARLRSAL